MIKSLRKIAGAGNSNAPPSLRVGKASAGGLEDDDEIQFHQAIPTSPGGTMSAIDHMNLPSLRPGAPTDLHQAVLSHDWDELRAKFGILDLDDALSIPSSHGAENGGDAPNKGDGVGQHLDFSAEADGKQQPTQQDGRKAESSLSNRQSLLRGRLSKKSSGGIADGSASGRGLLASSPDIAPNVHVASVSSPRSQPVKRQHCLSRDEGGRTPLHLILLRYTGGSLKKRTLRLRRAPDDVILGLIQLDPRAGGVPDREGLRPLHVAAREGHGIGVVVALLESFPGSAAERDGSDKFPLDYAMDYACQNARKKKTVENAGGGADDPRWLVVKRLLQESPEVAAVASTITSHQSQELSNQRATNPPFLLQALAKAAPESVVRLLIPSAAPYFSSRRGVNDACTALYLAVANRYSLELMKTLENICPSQTRSVRDETGMGLVAASYVVWAYGEGKSGDGFVVSGSEGGEKHWTKLKDHRDIVRSITKARDATDSGDGVLSPNGDLKTVNDVDVPQDFYEWWCKTKFWILHYRPESGFPVAFCNRLDGTMRADAADGPDYLLHAALSNPDTPSQVVHLILRLHPDLAITPSKINLRLPLHISVVTPSYTARHYEDRPLPCSTIEFVYRWHPPAIRVRDPASGRLPLHLALWEGRKTWAEGVELLVRSERRALGVRDWQPGGTDSTDEGEPTGLYPFQMAAVGRPQTETMKVRFAYMARNCHTNALWRGMSVRQRAAEVVRVQSEYDLEVLGTVFEVLRSDPCVLNSCNDEGASNVKLLTMRWGARAHSFSKGAPDGKSKDRISIEKTEDSANDKASPPPPPSASNQRHMEEVPDMFASPRSLNTEFTDDSYGPPTSSHALQFVVEEGEGKVTKMSPSPFVDEANTREERQHPTIEVPAFSQNSTPNHPTSPDAAESVNASPAGILFLSPDWFGSALGSPASHGRSTTSGASSDQAPQVNFDANGGAYGMPQIISERSKVPAASAGRNGKKSWFKGVRSFKNRRFNDTNDFKEMTTEEEKICNMLDSSYTVSALANAVGKMKGVPQQLTTNPSDDEEYWFISDPSFSPSSQGREIRGRPRSTSGGAVVNEVVGKTVKALIRSESEVERLIRKKSGDGTYPVMRQFQPHRLGIFGDWMHAYNVDEPGKETVQFDSKSLKSHLTNHLDKHTDPVKEIALVRRPRLESQSTTSQTSETAFGDTSSLCLHCISRRRQMLILPCRHVCLCGVCAKDNMIACCPMCQREIHCIVEVHL